MARFESVDEPQFGDIVRYYADKPIYEGLVFGGEVHAAVHIGKELYEDNEGEDKIRHVVLTKNGRSDLDFLIFQDMAGLDELYASGIELTDGSEVKKGYFRIRSSAELLDPATEDSASDANEAYLMDLRNYRKRWACLAGRIPPPPGGSCYSFPEEWEVLPAGQKNKR